VALLLLGAAGLLLPGLGAAPLERAEVYFMDAARAMVERGDYLVPRYQGEPFYDKPALTYWLMALAFRLRGFTPEAARLVPVAAALAALWATVWLGSLLFDRRAGLAGGVVQATTLLFMSFGRVAMSDMLLALWTTLAVALGVRLWRREGPAAEGTAILLGAVLGLGFLTKGPIALLLAGCGLGLLAWREGRRPPLGPRAYVLGLAAFVACGLGWFAALYLRMGGEPLRYFFLRENLERFAGETYDSGRSPLYYLGAYLAVGMPWSPLLPVAAWRLPRGERFLLAWLALMAVPLSLARGKIDYYLLPLLPAACLIVGRYLVAVPWRKVDRVWARVTLGLAAAGLLALLAPDRVVPAGWLPGPGPRLVLVAIVVAGSLAILAAALRPSGPRVLWTLAGGAAAVFVVLAASFLPAFRSAQPNAALVEDVLRERRYRPDAALAFCDDTVRVRRDLLFHARLTAEEHCALWAPASSPRPYLLLLRAEERAALATAELREVARYRGLPATALTLGGLVQGVSPQELVLAANFPTDDPVAEQKRKKDRKRALAEQAHPAH
jgi:4-amino-4-deoxy-L-arabinose transferase-like glycosyltransferase